MIGAMLSCELAVTVRIGVRVARAICILTLPERFEKSCWENKILHATTWLTWNGLPRNPVW